MCTCTSSHKISALCPKLFKSYCQKGSILVPFKTLGPVPFKTIRPCKYYISCIHTKFPFKTTAQVNRNFLSRPLYSPLHLTGIRPSLNAKFRSFQDPHISLFPGSWQVDNSFFNHQSSTGMQRTSNRHLMSGRVRSH